jgi:chromate transporter
MNELIQLHMAAADWLNLFSHFFSISLLAVGGAISTVPDMHRFLVDQQHWLTEAQFNASIAIAQAAPGPNVLFVALMGWNVGLNAGGLPQAFLGVLLSMSGILIPSAPWLIWPLAGAMKTAIDPLCARSNKGWHPLWWPC